MRNIEVVILGCIPYPPPTPEQRRGVFPCQCQCGKHYTWSEFRALEYERPESRRYEDARKCKICEAEITIDTIYTEIPVMVEVY